MTSLVVFKNNQGRLEGFGDKGRRAFIKFKKVVGELECGETMNFSFKLPRSPNHHKFIFAKLAALFDRQERFDDLDRLLDFLKVGSGFVDLFPGRDGVLVAVPQSINWTNLDEAGFLEFTRQMNDFLWTDYAQAALWPALDDNQRYACVDGWHREFERGCP